MTSIVLVLLSIALLILTVCMCAQPSEGESFRYTNFVGVYPGWEPRPTPNNSMIFPHLYNPVEEAERFCSAFGRIVPPSRQEDCPDSSFDFVDAQHMKIYTGDDAPSCMQLRALNYPNCYSKPDGTFAPWWFALETTSP